MILSEMLERGVRWLDGAIEIVEDALAWCLAAARRGEGAVGSYSNRPGRALPVGDDVSVLWIPFEVPTDDPLVARQVFSLNADALCPLPLGEVIWGVVLRAPGQWQAAVVRRDDLEGFDGNASRVYWCDGVGLLPNAALRARRLNVLAWIYAGIIAGLGVMLAFENYDRRIEDALGRLATEQRRLATSLAADPAGQGVEAVAASISADEYRTASKDLFEAMPERWRGESMAWSGSQFELTVQLPAEPETTELGELIRQFAQNLPDQFSLVDARLSSEGRPLRLYIILEPRS